MSIVLENRITVRLFVGCLITAEMKVLLDKSLCWKDSQIGASDEEGRVVTQHHQGKEYLGWFTSSIEVTISEVEKVEDRIKNEISRFCPTYELDKVSIVIFPQVFIS